ncbi:LacI family DNA-binding transcriptional regulator [Cellulomonas endophytica]|uniref:LacI family DNA-binding transcriptional regulator n=1 Tax=Cellulomonas endophytica TaxID=2494735 RepID=UPI001F0C805C|nr:LacI family DNA-binding transcriptional regulator [Cellulomonas endophytica]
MMRRIMAHGIDEVARAAGVSTATVSRALRGLPNVSDATRARVLAAATALGYVPSPSAASLASGRTRTIGLLTPRVQHWFFANVIEGAERALRRQGFDALLYTSADERPRRRVDPGVLRHRVDGVLVVGLPLEDAEVATLVALGRPLVFVGTGAPGQVVVHIDDLATAVAATEHLVGLGHRTVGLVTGEPDAAPWSPPALRTEGWRRTLLAAGLEAGPDLVEHGHFEVAGARAALGRLLDRRPDVTAVLAASDEMAMGVVLAARDLGRRVPEDLSVVGIDGHDLGELAGLTTMAQDALGQGATAARMLLDLLAGTSVPAEVVHPTQLVVRTSTAPPARVGGAAAPAPAAPAGGSVRGESAFLHGSAPTRDAIVTRIAPRPACAPAM